MRQWFILGFVILLVGCGNKPDWQPSWESSLQNALVRAEKEAKPIFLEFYAPW